MNQQTSNYFKRLLSQKSSESIAISLECTEIKLDKIRKNIQEATNLSIKDNSSAKIVKSRYLSENKFDQDNKITQLEENSKAQLLDLVQKIKRIRTQTETNLNSTISNLSKLNLQKNIVSSIRRQNEVLKYLKKIEEEKAKKVEEKAKQQQQMKNRQKQIINRLETLESQRQKRNAILSERFMQREPKYKAMEKHYLVKEIQKQLQDKTILKQQKEFKQKYKVPELSRNHNSSTLKQNANKKHLSTENDQLMYKLKKLSQFKNQLQKESRKIMHSMRKQKNQQIEIKKDKDLNPLKYNFLRAKNLTDKQIFNEFKDFQINLNSKSIGNVYLKDLKQKHLKPSKDQAEEVKKMDDSRSSELSGDLKLQNKAKLKSESNNSQNANNNIQQLQNTSKGVSRKITKSSSDQKIKDRSFQKQKNKFTEKMVEEDYLQFLKAKINSFHQFPFL